MSDAVLRFIGQDAGLAAQFARANQNLFGLEKNAARASSALDKGFTAAAGAVAAVSFVRLAKEAFELAENLEIASARTGVQIEALQRLQFIASQSETAVDAITTSINKLQINLVEGNDKATKALDRLGISITELNALRPDDQFLRIAEAIAEIESPAERSATAVALFGKGGAELLPLLSKGAQAVKELDVQFDQFGVTLSTETVHQVDDAGDAISRLGGATKSLGVELLALASPALTSAADGVTTFLKAFAFGVRGEGGGHGENVIANVTRDIELLQARIKFLSGEGGAHNSKLFGNELNEVIALRAQVDGLITRLEVIGGTGLGGISPLVKIGVSLDNVKLGGKDAKALAGIDLGPPQATVAEKRSESLRNDNPAVQLALEEKDFLTEINQEKLDELLRQETDHSLKAARIDSDLAMFKRDVRELFGLEEITFERGKTLTLGQIASGLFDVLARENSKVAKLQQALAIATTIWDTSRAVMKAFAEVPYPANFGVAALLAAQGVIQIAKIKSTNYGGGGGSVSSFSGGSAASSANTPAPNDLAAPGASQGRVLQVTVQGVITEAAVREIFDMAADMTENGFVFINQGSTQAQLIREGG